MYAIEELGNGGFEVIATFDELEDAQACCDPADVFYQIRKLDSLGRPNGPVIK